MRDTFAAVRGRRVRGERGFTLIELFVVGSDPRGAVSIVEQSNSDNGTHPTADSTLSISNASGTSQNYRFNSTKDGSVNSLGTATTC